MESEENEKETASHGGVLVLLPPADVWIFTQQVIYSYTWTLGSTV
jgi:hypothetical protein